MFQNDKRVTIKMISEKSGLSVGTVDRVLNKREGVSENSRQHILKIAEELGYRPNKFASALGRKKELRIGIIYPEKPEDFYKDITDGIELAKEELDDYGVRVDTFRYPTFSPINIKECFESINVSLYDGFAVNPAGGNIITNYIDEFASLGKPTITFNTDAPNSLRKFYYGSNAYQSGMIAGELLSSIMNKSGNVLVIGNLSKMSPFLERLNGFLEYLQSYAPDIYIHICADCYPGYEHAEKSLSDFLSSTPNIQGIYCTGYSSTVGALNALKNLNRKDIKVIGYDVTQITANAIKDDWCNILLHQYPFQQGHQTAHLIVKHLLENWTPSKQQIYLDTQIVIKSNIENYIKNNQSYLIK